MPSTTHAAGETRSPSAGLADTGSRRILVWDIPTRIGHWLLAGSFALAWLTSESESLRNVHVASGYVFGAVLAFRLLWGLTGSRHARFAAFVRAQRTAWAYLQSLRAGRPQHYAGHNPAGAWAILALLGLGAIGVASGWLTFNEIGGDLFEELHEGATGAMLAVVVVHLAGVAVGSIAHRENLVAAMFSGYKRGTPRDGIARRHAFAGSLLVAWVVAVVTFLMI